MVGGLFCDFKPTRCTAVIQIARTPDSLIAPNNALHDWLATRANLKDYVEQGLPYPVFVIAASGGGGYAAAHSYLFQAKMAEICPNFAQHLFAVTGVSGGAIGNVQASANLNLKSNPDDSLGCSEKKITLDVPRLLSNDHLSVLLFSMLFRDFPNRFLFGALGKRDRVSAFRASLEGDLGIENKASRGVISHYWDGDDGSFFLRGGPAQIAVATDILTGQPYTFSPIAAGDTTTALDTALGIERISFLTDADEEHSDSGRMQDVPLSEAALASAAFPYVSPFMRLTFPNDGTPRHSVLVDGGYYDNSGLSSMLGLLEPLNVFEASRSTGIDFQDPDSGWDNVFEKYGRELPEQLQNCSFIGFRSFPLNANDFFEEFLSKDDEGKLSIKPLDKCLVHFAVYTIILSEHRGAPLDCSRFLDKQSPVDCRDSASGSLQNYFLDPLRALLAVRPARSVETIDLYSRLYCGGCSRSDLDEYFFEGRVIQHFVDVPGIGLPLGWYIPESAISELEAETLPAGLPKFEQVSEDCEIVVNKPPHGYVTYAEVVSKLGEIETNCQKQFTLMQNSSANLNRLARHKVTSALMPVR